MKGQICGLVIRSLAVAVLTTSGEIEVWHGVIANVGNRCMAITAVYLGVPLTGRITRLADPNESDGKEGPDQENGDFKLGSVPGDSHIWSIGIPRSTVLCESCTVWMAGNRNPTIPSVSD